MAGSEHGASNPVVRYTGHMDTLYESSKIPLLQALEKFQGVETASLHVPGHKAGRGLSSEFAKYAVPLARIDATELPGLDDLHDPHGVIKEAERLAAIAWGSDHAFFLINGSTVGNLVAIMSVVSAGDTVIVGRDAHQSVWHALELARANAVAVTPLHIGSLVAAIRPEDVVEAIQAHPEAVAVIITSPTYHGIVPDLITIVQLAHDNGMMVIVDEAHGAHLAFHPDLPDSAVSAKADLVVQSAHKMTAAFTQTALLHVCGEKVDMESLRHYLRVFQTSSPSYILLASIDAARAQLVSVGQALIEQTMSYLQGGKKRLDDSFPGLINGGFEGLVCDPFKWTVWSARWGVPGEELANAFMQSGVFIELYDNTHVLLVWSYANSKRDLERVIRVLDQVFCEKSRVAATANLSSWAQELPRYSSVLSWDLHTKIKEEAPFAELPGKRAARAITLYPPGIPLLLPGEEYTINMIQYIKKCVAYGLRVDGLANAEEGRAWFLVE